MKSVIFNQRSHIFNDLDHTYWVWFKTSNDQGLLKPFKFLNSDIWLRNIVDFEMIKLPPKNGKIT